MGTWSCMAMIVLCDRRRIQIVLITLAIRLHGFRRNRRGGYTAGAEEFGDLANHRHRHPGTSSSFGKASGGHVTTHKMLCAQGSLHLFFKLQNTRLKLDSPRCPTTS